MVVVIGISLKDGVTSESKLSRGGGQGEMETRHQSRTRTRVQVDHSPARHVELSGACILLGKVRVVGYL